MTHDRTSVGFKNRPRGVTAQAQLLETVIPLSRTESVHVLRDGAWSS